MKKIFIALTVACAALVLSSCEKRLEIQQHSVLAMEDFYKTDADAESALVNAYYTAGRFYSNSMWLTSGWNECHLIDIMEFASDANYVAGQNKADQTDGNQINAFWVDANNPFTTGAYEAYYMIIQAANLVIDHFDGELADSQVKKRCVAEARILRAYTHFMLAETFGNAPIVDHCLTGADRPGNSESTEAVYQFVVDDCVAALNDLRSKSSLNDKNGAIVITKEFALSLEGKALMFMGKYSEAKSVLKQVIDSGKYDLVPSNKMTSLYHYSGRGNEETMFEFNLKYDASVGDYYWRAQPNFISLWGWRTDKMNMPSGPGSELTDKGGWGWLNPSKKFVDALIKNDGMESARRKAWIKSFDEILYEMPYVSDFQQNEKEEIIKDEAGNPLPKTNWTKEDKKKDPNRGITAADGIYGNCGWFMWKRLFRAEDRAENNETQWNLVVMRYAEVLLMYAECCAQTSDASGLTYLNKIQERAQAKHKSTSLTLAEVQNEKFLECWLEATRFPDLVRWGIAEQELKDNGKYIPNYCDEMFTKNAAEHKGYIDDSDADWNIKAHPQMGFKKGRNEVFPFPFNELNVNPNLVQNPGY